MTPLRLIIVGTFIVAVTGFPLRQALRSGVVRLKGPHGRTPRRERPARYWVSIIVMAGFLMAGLALTGIGIAGAVWPSR